MKISFWAGKNVFVTGHTGFKGSWLSLWLQRLGAKVVGYSLAPPSQPNLYDLTGVADGMVSIQGDVRDATHLTRVLTEHQPEIIFHLAAQSLVRYSYVHPVETYATNVMGTVNLLQAARESKSVKGIVIVTSDKCYGNMDARRSYREDDVLGGSDPYSNSKGCVELVVSAFRASYFSNGASSSSPVSVGTARAGNVIGGGDWAQDRLVPDIMRAMMERRPAVVRNPHAIRPWQHVLEPLQGYLMLAERLYLHEEGFSEAWNFGPDEDDAKPVAWVAEYLTRLWGCTSRWELASSSSFSEAACLTLDAAKARRVLGWSPKLDLPKALDWTVEWYRRYVDHEDMRAVTEQDIERFQNL